jgi:glycine/D-amino acid oxidase-like deaminating enzyme/nitrite reductase/ring-hydroxylating ferredoxin subunit
MVNRMTDDDVPQDTPRVQGLEADVVVIGAGITGLTAALALKRAARRVVVLDARAFKESESCRTTAHLTEVLDTRLATLLRRFGPDDTRLILEGQRHAIEQIETWVRELGPDCGFERLPGFLYAAAGDRLQQQALEAEAAAAAELGYGDISTQKIPVPFSIAGALRFDNQAQFRPGPYLAALETQIGGHGSVVTRGLRVHGIEDDGGPRPCRVSTSGGDVFADRVIVATHVPIGERPSIHAKLSAYRSYVIAAPIARPLGALLWDLADPYHHARTVRIGARHYLITGGGDHRVGEKIDTRQVLRELADFASSQFGPLAISHRWSGQIIETSDGLPYAGADAEGGRVLFATGLSGNGFTNGTLAGLVLADTVRGHDNRWARLLSPARALSLASMSRRVGRNLAAAKQRLAGRLKEHPISIQDLAPGAGTITRHRGEKVAVYREAGGGLLAVSAACPHRRGSVQWNRAEKSWDCPSCGSRFALSGEVLNGPAVRGLSARRLDEPRPPMELTVHVAQSSP